MTLAIIVILLVGGFLLPIRQPDPRLRGRIRLELLGRDRDSVVLVLNLAEDGADDEAGEDAHGEERLTCHSGTREGESANRPPAVQICEA